MTRMKNNRRSLFITPSQVTEAEGHFVDFEIDIHIELSNDIGRIPKRVQGWLSFEQQENLLHVNGELAFEIFLICDRCLKEYPSSLKLDIQESLEIVNQKSVEPELELNYQETFEQVLRDETLDIQDLMRQHIILSLPLKKLCSENCYNEVLNKFNKEEVQTDPRWDKLKELTKSWES